MGDSHEEETMWISLLFEKLLNPPMGGTLVVPISASRDAKRFPIDSLVDASSHSIGDVGKALYSHTCPLLPTYRSSSSRQDQGVVHRASVSG